MSRKINYPLPKPTRVAPYCGRIHEPAEQLRCKQCGEAFLAAGAAGADN